MNELKKLAVDDETEIYFRPNTYDEVVINEVFTRSAYLLPKIEVTNIFDIGANIGASAVLLAKTYPKATIHCFEPDPDNFNLLEKNTMKYGSRIVRNKVALSDFVGVVRLYEALEEGNHGGLSIEGKRDVTRAKVPVIPISQYISKVGCPEIIKIDCEGSESSIIHNIEDLSKVQWITGELHNTERKGCPWKLLERLSLTHHIHVEKSFGQTNWPFHAGRFDLFG